MAMDTKFKKMIRAYYRSHARPMPWRRTRDSYRILVSEIMLQQTQVGRVGPFYKKFIAQFPNFRTLARAKTPDVLRAWQGLGYNRRALALQQLARDVVEKHNGRLPRSTNELIALPGIGKYTAGAIRAFAINEPEIFIETNIRRVFIHFYFSSAKKRAKPVTDAELRRYIKRTIDIKNPREWYYALMDYGSMLGTAAQNKKIPENPNRRSAHYARQSSFVGSDRQIRGRILRDFLAHKKISTILISKELDQPREKVLIILKKLKQEGFLT